MIPSKRVHAFLLSCLFAAASLTTVVARAKEPSRPSPDKEASQAGQTYQIRITPDPTDAKKPPKVDPSDQTVGPNDEVMWICTTGCDFDVVFTEPDRKPFKDRKFDKVKNKSGRPTGSEGVYKYSVIVGPGSNDPNIIIPK